MTDEQDTTADIGGLSSETLASLFATEIQMSLNETRLIWARYSAFLVAISLITNIIYNMFFSVEYLYITVQHSVVTVGGTSLCGAWFVLNGRGWSTQDLQFRRAGKTYDKILPNDLFFQSFRNDTSPSPKGFVYTIAQIPPIVFVFMMITPFMYRLFVGSVTSVNFWDLLFLPYILSLEISFLVFYIAQIIVTKQDPTKDPR